MPTQIRPTFRQSSEGANYEAVKFAIKRSAPAGKSEFRTVDSLKSEQRELSEQRHRHRVRVRRRHAPGQGGHGIKITKRGVFYALATLAMVVFVKFMLSQAGHGGFLDDPDVGKEKVLVN